MNSQNIYIILVLLIFLYASYSTRKLRRRIKCRYTSQSKQTYNKVVLASSSWVIFEGKKFYIIPNCVKHHWVDEGIGWLFPTFMPEMDFVWNSKYPVDPNTALPVVLSPEVENTIDEENSFRSYAGGQKQMLATQGSGKLSGFSKYIPWIALIGVALVAVYFYTQNQKTAADMLVVKKALQDLLNRFGGQ